MMSLLLVIQLVVVGLIIAGFLLWRRDRRMRREHPHPLYLGLLTCFLLVLLRLAIGWHFLFEGAEKVQSKSWTSEPYLRESAGPLAGSFRWMAGDPLLERLRPLPADAEGQPNHKRFPPLLARDWQLYYDAFAAYYDLDAKQREEADMRFRQNQEQTALWLLQGSKRVKREAANGPAVEVDLTTPQRVEEYEKKVRDVHDLQERQLKLFGPDVNARLRAAKADANRLRADLRRDLDEQNAAFKKALKDVLTAEQIKKGLRAVLDETQLELAEVKKAMEAKSPAGVDITGEQQKVDAMTKSLATVLRPEQLNQDPLEGSVRPAWRQMTRLEYIDTITKWGLLAVGVCLLIGLFTRTACVAGAMFLLMFFLAMPALPGLPDNPRAEGHYFIINKNVIEMLALLALATTRSGRWLGLDGLLQFLNPGRWRSAPAPTQRVEPPEFASELPVNAHETRTPVEIQSSLEKPADAPRML